MTVGAFERERRTIEIFFFLFLFFLFFFFLTSRGLGSTSRSGSAIPIISLMFSLSREEASVFLIPRNSYYIERFIERRFIVPAKSRRTVASHIDQICPKKDLIFFISNEWRYSVT